MSVQSEINRITTAVASAYDAVDDIGGTLPASTVVENLATAISSIADSVTENYTNVSSASAKTKVLHGSSFYQKIVPDDGYLISSVTVTMGGVDITSQVFSGDTGSSGGGTTPTGTLSIVQNGTYDVTNYASAEVDVPSETPDLGTKSITANGTYNASSDSLDGYSSVTVDVPTGASYDYNLGGFVKGSNYTLEVEHGNHVVYKATGSVSSTSYSLRQLGTTLNLPTWISVPSGSEVVITISNVVNASGLIWAANIKNANSTTSMSYGTGNGTHLSGATVSRTTTAAENWGCLFFYVASASNGAALEFDVSISIDGVRIL